MARRKFKDFTKGVTPVGRFAFPKLQVPDTKYNPDGELSVGVELSGVDAENLKEIIQEAFDIEYAHECTEHGKTLKKYENMPYKPTLDRDKEPVEGSTTFRLKRKASGTYGKNHSKAGTRWEASFPIFSASGTSKVTEPIWGGSTGRISFIIVPWYTPALGFGVRLQIEAVKILTLVTQGDKDPGQFGFEDESGYEAPSEKTSAAPEVEDGVGSEESEGGTDF
jgi:hypothetical protein